MDDSQYHTRATQKAKGISYIQENPATFNPFEIAPHWFLPASTAAADVRRLGKHLNFPLFVRPCPKVPKHGFVDSRIVFNADTLADVFEETHKQDKGAEVAITDPLDATANGVLANGVLSLGPGNDGATSGKQTVSMHVNGEIIKRESLPTEIIPETEECFYEFVYGAQEPHVVQMRSGPRMNGMGADFIPKATTVTEILKAEGDLVEWETLINSKKGVEGVVIDHKGGTMASHYAVHGYLNDIPVLCSRSPEQGEILEPTVEKNEIDKEVFFEGFKRAVSSDVFEPHDKTCWLTFAKKQNKDVKARMKKSLRVTLSVLHNLPSFTFDSEEESRLAGMACGFFCRVGISLCAGEARYKDPTNFPGCRENVYEETFNKKKGILPEVLANAAYCFKYANWGHGGGYGGPRWLECAEAMIAVWNAAVIGDPKTALADLNKGINLAHNGGWLFNKVMSSTEMDQAAEAPTSFAVRRGNEIYHAATAPSMADKFFKKMKSWATVAIKKLAIKKVDFEQVQIRLVGDNVKIQAKKKGDTLRDSVTVSMATLYKHAKNIGKYPHTAPSMYEGSNAMYVPLELRENGFYYMGGKMVIGKKQLSGFFHNAGEAA